MFKTLERWEKVESQLEEKASRYEDKSYNNTRFKYQAIAIKNCRKQMESLIENPKKWYFDKTSFFMGLAVFAILTIIYITIFN